jgi:arginine decarboxylase-like protein
VCQARGALGEHLGEKGKFMFTASPGLSVFARFTSRELLDYLQLLHGCSSTMRTGTATTLIARGDGQRSFR